VEGGPLDIKSCLLSFLALSISRLTLLFFFSNLARFASIPFNVASNFKISFLFFSNCGKAWLGDL